MPQPVKQFTFETNPTVDAIESVPEHYRSFYEAGEEEGTFKLQDNPIIQGATQGIDKLAKALASERTGRKADKAGIVDLSPLSEFGATPADILSSVQAKIDELQSAATSGTDAKEALANVKIEMNKLKDLEVGKRDTTIDSLKGQIYQMQVNGEGERACIASGANTEDIEFIMGAAKPYIQQIERDGAVKTVVVDAEGQTRFAQNPAGDMAEMTVSQLILEMKAQPKYAKFYKSEVPDGTTPRIPGQRVVPEMNSVQKISAGLKAGQYQK